MEELFYELPDPELAELHLSGKKWRREQLRRLWILIGISFTGDTESGKAWRMMLCYRIFRKRLWNLENCDWWSFIAGMSDNQMTGDIRRGKLRRDLVRIRDVAKNTCRSWDKDVI